MPAPHRHHPTRPAEIDRARFPHPAVRISSLIGPCRHRHRAEERALGAPGRLGHAHHGTATYGRLPPGRVPRRDLLEIDDLCRQRRGGWAGLRRAAGIDHRPPGDEDRQLEGSTGRMLHIDDLERLDFLAAFLGGSSPPPASAFAGRARRLLAMAHFSLWGWNESLDNLDRQLGAALGERQPAGGDPRCARPASRPAPAGHLPGRACR